MRKMKTLLITGAGLLILLVLTSCGGKKEVKQPSQESKTSIEAFALAETIRNAFLKNDKDTLQKNSSEAGYKDITSNKKPYDTVEITFTPRWVEIDNQQINLNITWKSAWTTSGRRTDGRGMAVFVMEGKPLKVVKILRANPFIYPEQ